MSNVASYTGYVCIPRRTADGPPGPSNGPESPPTSPHPTPPPHPQRNTYIHTYMEKDHPRLDQEDCAPMNSGGNCAKVPTAAGS